jgi:hypothetical protein
MVICPDGPDTSNIPARPASAPEMPRQKTIFAVGFTPANLEALGACPVN